MIYISIYVYIYIYIYIYRYVNTHNTYDMYVHTHIVLYIISVANLGQDHRVARAPPPAAVPEGVEDGGGG